MLAENWQLCAAARPRETSVLPPLLLKQEYQMQSLISWPWGAQGCWVWPSSDGTAAGDLSGCCRSDGPEVQCWGCSRCSDWSRQTEPECSVHSPELLAIVSECKISISMWKTRREVLSLTGLFRGQTFSLFSFFPSSVTIAFSVLAQREVGG